MHALADLLRLLGDETRVRILHLLIRESLTVGELQELLDLSQSSVSGHLSKLRRAGFIHSQAEGSAHRYHLREDLGARERSTWQTIYELSQEEASVAADRERLDELIDRRNRSWVDRVAGSLHRSYAPGRTWDSLAHAFISLAELGRCADIGAGDGALLELLAPRCQELICIDPSPAMVAAGEARIGELRVPASYQQAAAEALPLGDASCDTVLFLQSLQYVDDPARSLAEAERVLRPGGRLLILTLATHDHSEAERYGHRHQGFDAKQLQAWLAQCHCQMCYQLPPESRPPRFSSLLFLARRSESL